MAVYYIYTNQGLVVDLRQHQLDVVYYLIQPS